MSTPQDWVHHCVSQAQVAAGRLLTRSARPISVIVDLAEKLPPPPGPIEFRVAAYFIQRTAWDTVQRRVTASDLTYADGFRLYNSVVRATERRTWPAVVDALHSVAISWRTPATAEVIRDVLDTRFCEQLSLSVIAKSAGVSVRKATSEFRSGFGMSIHEYLTRRRLGHAVRLLLDTDMKASSIATAVGLNDRAAFHRQFRRRLGVPPGDVRSRTVDLESLLERVSIDGLVTQSLR